ncbi:hypothetical protein KTI63_07265 [Acinetobacter guillouiae]|uniref:hypothetical protein n=1 Tax=Acinetobacter guillouiae TaxID=106649 RepID=UPI0021CEC5A7|nr:hypothetical protein [Acinetobacter guillouiae]MCU4492271.1 hypothetical protein [Acinetobacter guillouiae]
MQIRVPLRAFERDGVQERVAYQEAPTYRNWNFVGAIASGSNGTVGTSFAKVLRGKLQENAIKDCQKKVELNVMFGLLRLCCTKI